MPENKESILNGLFLYAITFCRFMSKMIERLFLCKLTFYENNLNNVFSSTRDNNDVELSYHINSSWGEHYNVDVTLTNITDEKIDDWEIKLPANFFR